MTESPYQSPRKLALEISLNGCKGCKVFYGYLPKTTTDFPSTRERQVLIVRPCFRHDPIQQKSHD